MVIRFPGGINQRRIKHRPGIDARNGVRSGSLTAGDAVCDLCIIEKED